MLSASLIGVWLKQCVEAVEAPAHHAHRRDNGWDIAMALGESRRCPDSNSSKRFETSTYELRPAHVYDTFFHPVIGKVKSCMVVLADQSFHAAADDLPNLGSGTTGCGWKPCSPLGSVTLIF
ncbi:MAG: hypothetical protein U1F76_21370 [Candidatus Competibacteraceae bacterium]